MQESSWIALLSVTSSSVVAVLSLWFAYKSRSFSHREFLYEKQYEAFATVLPSLLKLYYRSRDFLTQEDSKLEPAALARLREEYNEFARSQAEKMWLIFPNDVQIAIREFFFTINAITGPDRIRPVEALVSSFIEVLREMRKSMGVDPLSDEILKIVGE